MGFGWLKISHHTTPIRRNQSRHPNNHSEGLFPCCIHWYNAKNCLAGKSLWIWCASRSCAKNKDSKSADYTKKNLCDYGFAIEGFEGNGFDKNIGNFIFSYNHQPIFAKYLSGEECEFFLLLNDFLMKKDFVNDSIYSGFNDFWIEYNLKSKCAKCIRCYSNFGKLLVSLKLSNIIEYIEHLPLL